MQGELPEQVVIYKRGDEYREFKFSVERVQGRWYKVGPTIEVTENTNQEDMRLAAFLWEEEGDTELVGSLNIFPVIDGWKPVFRGWYADNLRPPMSPERIQEIIRKLEGLGND